MKSSPDWRLEIEREEDGRWIAEVPAVPGAMAYGATPEEAADAAEALALRALAERLKHGAAERGRAGSIGTGQEPDDP